MRFINSTNGISDTKKGLTIFSLFQHHCRPKNNMLQDYLRQIQLRNSTQMLCVNSDWILDESGKNDLNTFFRQLGKSK